MLHIIIIMAPSAPLSAEPAVPEVREQLHLPPKSFADAAAVEDPAPSSGATSETSDTRVNGSNGGVEEYYSVNKDDDKTVKHKASVLRIVDTHPEGETDGVSDEEKEEKNDENKPLKEESEKISRNNSKKSKDQNKKIEPKEEIKQPEKAEEKERPLLDRQESKHEYSATVSPISIYVSRKPN